MNILIANNTSIPAYKYGGTERVIWSLGKSLVKQQHQVAYFVKSPSACNFAPIFYYVKKLSLQDQLYRVRKSFRFDIVHIFFNFQEKIDYPYLVTNGGNGRIGELFPLNTVFVSRNHAQRHGSKHFVYNGMDWSDYPVPKFSGYRKDLIFLSDINRPEKNLSDSLQIAHKTNYKIIVMGGRKLVWRRKVKYLGMVNNEVKATKFSHAQAMLFPIRWHEPFGIAVIEAMYYGCPVLATPYGSMPEIITPETGYLGKSIGDFIDILDNWGKFTFNSHNISEYVQKNYSAEVMTMNYLVYYKKIISGEKLNTVCPSVKENSDRNHLLPLN